MCHVANVSYVPIFYSNFDDIVSFSDQSLTVDLITKIIIAQRAIDILIASLGDQI